jgi:acetoin utilization protein AcuB
MQRTHVSDLMSSPVISIRPETRVPAAMALMRQHHIRHLPVVENARLVGIVSQGDLREMSITAAISANSYELNFQLSRLPIGQIMTRRVFTVTPEALVVHAAELMTEHKIAGLPVVEPGGEVIGMVTESDLLKLLVRHLQQNWDNGEQSESAERLK